MKPHHFSFLMVASYIAANAMLFASSRDQIQEKKFQPEHIQKLEEVAAQIIAAQPPQVQAQLLLSVSEYLAKEKMVDVAPQEISKQLIARITETTQSGLARAAENQWAQRTAEKIPAEVGRV